MSNRFVNKYSSSKLTYDETYNIIEEYLEYKLFTFFKKGSFNIKLHEFSLDSDGSLKEFLRIEVYTPLLQDAIFHMYSCDIDFVEKELTRFKDLKTKQTTAEFTKMMDDLKKGAIDIYPELISCLKEDFNEKPDYYANGLDLLKMLW